MPNIFAKEHDALLENYVKSGVQKVNKDEI